MLNLGDHINNQFRVEAFLGKGGMGEVYRVTDLENSSGPSLALKILPTLKTSNEQNINALKSEFSFLTELSHPYLAKVFDFGKHSKTQQAFFTIEYIDGPDLIEHLAPLSTPQKLLLFLKILSGLAYIHSKNILHNDLKPSNIRIDSQTGNPKILDFGISIPLQNSTPNEKGKSTLKKGTPYYMAPEIFQDHPPSIWSDFYSLGMILYKFFAEILPYSNDSLEEVITKKCSQNIPSPKIFNAEINHSIEALILWLLERKPKNRPQKISEISQRIRTILENDFNYSNDDFLFEQKDAVQPYGKDEIITSVSRNIKKALSTQNKPNETTTLDLNTIDSEPAINVIYGKQGQGKTFLLNHFKKQYQIKDVLFLYIPCSQCPGPLGSWKKVIQKIDNISPGTRRNSEEQERLALALSILDKQKNSQNEMELFFHLISFLTQSFSRSPFILGFDNSETMDPMSIRFLHHIARLQTSSSAQKWPPVIATTSSKSFISTLPNLQDRIFHLNNFSFDICRDYINDFLWPESIPELSNQKINEKAGGNPKFIREIIYNLFRVSKKSGKLNLTDLNFLEKSIPSTLAEILQNKIDQLSEEEKSILKWVSIWGAAISEDTLGHLVDQEPEVLKVRIQSLISEEILNKLDEDSFYFSNDFYPKYLEKHFKPQKTHYKKALGFATKAQEPDHDLLGRLHKGAQNFSQACIHQFEAAMEAKRLFAYPQAISNFNQILKNKSKIQPKPREYFLSIFNLAECLWRTGSRKESTEYYKMFKAEIQSDSFQSELIKCNRALGIYHRDLKEFDIALHIFTDSLVAHEDLKTIDRVHFTAQISLIHLLQNNQLKQKQFETEALNLLKQIPESDLEKADQFILLAYISGLNRNFVQAHGFAKQALNIYRDSNNPRGIANALTNLGSYEASQELFNKAKNSYAKAIESAQKAGDVVNLAHSQFFLANIYFLEMKYNLAEDLFQKALSMAIQLDHIDLKIQLLANLASLELDRGGLTLAGNYIGQVKLFSNEQKIELKSGLFLLANYKYRVLTGQNELAKTLKKQILENQTQEFQANLLIFDCYWEIANKNLKNAERLIEKVSTLLETYEVSSSCETQVLLLQSKIALSKNEKNNLEIYLDKLRSDKNINDYPIFRISFESLWLQSKTANSKEIPIFEESSNRLIEKLKNCQNPFLKFEVYRDIGNLFKNRNLFEKAQACFKQAHLALEMILVSASPTARNFLLEKPVYKEFIEFINHLPQNHFPQSGDDVELSEKYEHLKEIIRLNEELAIHAHDISPFLGHVMKKILQITGAQRVFLIQKESDGFAIRYFDYANNPQPGTPSLKEVSQTVIERVMRRGLAEQIDDATQHAELSKQESVIELNIKSIMVAPIRHHDQVLGVLYVDKPETANFFEPFHLELLNLISTQISISIHLLNSLEESQTQSDRLTIELEKAKFLLKQQNQNLNYRYDYENIIGGKDPSMQKVFKILDQVIPSDVSVLVEGESGTGKELIAKAIHFNGPRKNKPFIAINCAAINPNLIEAELFGFQKGAFSGAEKDKEGQISLAHSGTLFLDEVNSIPMEFQAKLLRVLQEREIRPVGGQKTIKIDVRLITASNEPLENLVERQRFRKDLYYRICVVNLILPPLRERPLDMDDLIDYFIKRISLEKLGKYRKTRTISARARKALHQYTWPGNIRELHHVLEQAIVLAPNQTLQLRHFSKTLRDPLKPIPNQMPKLEEARKNFDREYIEKVLMAANGSVRKAAEIAGIRRESLSRLIARYNIKNTISK